MLFILVVTMTNLQTKGQHPQRLLRCHKFSLSLPFLPTFTNFPHLLQSPRTAASHFLYGKLAQAKPGYPCRRPTIFLVLPGTDCMEALGVARVKQGAGLRITKLYRTALGAARLERGADNDLNTLVLFNHNGIAGAVVNTQAVRHFVLNSRQIQGLDASRN